MRIRITDGPLAGKLRVSVGSVGERAPLAVVNSVNARRLNMFSRVKLPTDVVMPMTGLQSPSPFVATATGWYNGGSPSLTAYPWYAFNRSGTGNSYGGSFVSNVAPSVSAPVGVCIDLGSFYAISSYALVNRNTSTNVDSPRDWTLEYSLDNRTWVVADTQAGNTLNAQAASKGPFTIPETVARYWRIMITARNGTANQVCIGELVLSGLPAATPVFTPANTVSLETTTSAGSTNGSEWVGVIGFSAGVASSLRLRVTNATPWPPTIDVWTVDKNWTALASHSAVVTAASFSFNGGLGAQLSLPDMQIPDGGGLLIRSTLGLSLANGNATPGYLPAYAGAAAPSVGNVWAPSRTYGYMPVIRVGFSAWDPVFGEDTAFSYRFYDASTAVVSGSTIVSAFSLEGRPHSLVGSWPYTTSADGLAGLTTPGAPSFSSSGFENLVNAVPGTGNPITWVALVRSNADANGYFFDGASSGESGRHTLLALTGKWQINLFGRQATSGTITITPNTTYAVAITGGRTGAITLYIRALNSPSVDTYVFTPAAASLSIGGLTTLRLLDRHNGNGSTYPLTGGHIHALALYDRALSSGEIAQVFDRLL